MSFYIISAIIYTMADLTSVVFMAEERKGISAVVWFGVVVALLFVGALFAILFLECDSYGGEGGYYIPRTCTCIGLKAAIPA